MKADERWLLRHAQEQMKVSGAVDIRDLISQHRVSKQRVGFIFQKWTLRGWYDYEDDLWRGRLTDEGMSEECE